MSDIHLEEYTQVSLAELADGVGYSEAEIRELVALGALEPYDRNASEWSFSASYIARIRNVRQLQNDFELSLAGVALVLAYRERIDDLERRLRLLEYLLPNP